MNEPMRGTVDLCYTERYWTVDKRTNERDCRPVLHRALLDR